MSVTTKNMTVRGVTNVNTRPLLDEFPNAAAAYSLRKLRSDYTGNSIRVRRSSDNTEQDIGFNIYGELDVNSLYSFVGSNSGYIAKWYDQSNNIKDLAQSTSANQPRIINAGNIEFRNNKPAIYFNGSSYYMGLGSFASTLNQPNTIFIGFYLDMNAFTTNGFTLYDASSGNRNTIGGYGTSDSGKTFMYSGTTILSASALTGLSSYIFSSLYSGSSSYTYSNGSSIISGNAGTQSLSNLYLGKNVGVGVSYHKGNIFEFIIYNSDKSSIRTKIENYINAYYSIY